MNKYAYLKLSAALKLSLIIVVILSIFLSGVINLISADAVRGQPNDLWADLELGQRDFAEIMPTQVRPDYVRGSGIVVDSSIGALGFAYIWDGAFSRIVGIDLETCYNTDELERCSADLIIGQPSGTDYGSCNQNGSFENAPVRSPASASTLCSVPEWTHTTLEDKSFTSMYLDGDGNLYVFDTQNNRVLKYNSPTTEDTIADEVWGQPDFANNECNLTSVWGQTPSQPTASSLCYSTAFAVGAGVTLDSDGNLWVADGGNSRVLRFPESGGIISKTADLVLGQEDFTTGGEGSEGGGIDEMWGPSVVRFGSDNNLYVMDVGNRRVLRFEPPFTSGMDASDIVLDTIDLNEASDYLEVDPTGNYLWTGTPSGSDIIFRKWDLNGGYQDNSFVNWLQGAGSIGFDAEGNILIPNIDIVQYEYDSIGDIYTEGKYFFRYWEGPTRAFNRIRQGGWGGMGITSSNQLIVTDGRLLFWNNPLAASNGATPNGYVGGASDIDFAPNFGILAIDDSNRIYVQKDNKSIAIYQGPLTGASTPIKTITAPFDLLGGGTIDLQVTMSGIAVSEDGEYLWLSDTDSHRVFRIRGPLTDDPVVDIILGQTNSSSTSCNQGSTADLDTLCDPGALKFDNFGNLYVSDHFFEAAGNYRLLMFSPDTFPASPVSILYAPNATKEFPADGTHGSTQSHAHFEVAFDRTNRMVTGYNPYRGGRFVEYYNQPQLYNSGNPSDPSYAEPSGQLEDFYGWPFALSFDSEDNLFVYDTNRGKVMAYETPFGTLSPILAQVTAVPSTTPDPTPNYTFSSTKVGSITYGGDCSSGTTSASVGNNTITFNTLSPGAHSNCTIQVTDSEDNVSLVLQVSSFTVENCGFLKTKGDFNCNHTVDLSDLSILASYWLLSNSVADANGNNFTDLTDLSILSFNWLQSF